MEERIKQEFERRWQEYLEEEKILRWFPAFWVEKKKSEYRDFYYGGVAIATRELKDE